MTEETKHAPLPVAGYQAQGSEKIDLVNRNKEIEERVLRILDDLQLMASANHFTKDGYPLLDGRWLAIGRTHIEQGFMAVNRAVFQPLRVKLSEDQA